MAIAVLVVVAITWATVIYLGVRGRSRQAVAGRSNERPTVRGLLAGIAVIVIVSAWSLTRQHWLEGCIGLGVGLVIMGIYWHRRASWSR
jgi:hypothetical protein